LAGGYSSAPKDVSWFVIGSQRVHRHPVVTQGERIEAIESR